PLTLRERRLLAGDVVGLPPPRVPQQRRRFVVEVVARCHDIEPEVHGHAVEHVALGQPARRAGRTRPLLAGGGAVEAVLAADVDHGRTAAPLAFHGRDPPLMTGRTSISSASARRSSRVTSARSRMTSTVSGSIPSSERTSRTLRGPASWTSRSGLRSLTFTQ